MSSRTLAAAEQVDRRSAVARRVQVQRDASCRRPGGGPRRAHTPPGSSPERWTTIGSPSGSRPSSAAGTVAEVFTTIRSPGVEERAEVVEAGVDRRARRRGSRAVDRGRARRPDASGGSWASWAGSRTKSSGRVGGRSVRHGVRRLPRAPPRAPVAPARLVARDQGQQSGHARLRRGSVGDVLARERVLVHLGAHVAGIDDEDPQVGSLDGEDPTRVLERGLRRAVAAPARVRLDRGVGGDVRRSSRRGASCASSACVSAIGAITLTSKTVRSTSGSMVAERRERARAQRARVVARAAVRGPSSAAARASARAVLGVGHVAGDADDGGLRARGGRPRRRGGRRGGRRSRATNPRRRGRRRGRARGPARRR